MSIKFVFLLSASIILFTGCNSSKSVVTPVGEVPLISTETKTPTPTETKTPIPTETLLPTKTPIPTATIDPLIPLKTPQPNDHMKTWGWKGIQVWTSNGPLVSCRNGRGTDFICGDDPNKNIYSWDNNSPWYFAGQAEMAKMQTVLFQFDQPYKTVLITANNLNEWALDSIEGILADGRKVPFGYAIGNDGKTLVPNHLYFDTPNTPLDLDFFLANERQNIAPASVMDCGMVGKAPDGNYTIIQPGGAGTGNVILFRLLYNPNASDGFRGEGAYDLVGIEITYGKVPLYPQKCPVPNP